MKKSKIFSSSFSHFKIGFDWTRFDPSTDYLQSHKRTKNENIFALILVIFDFEPQTGPIKQRTDKTAVISKKEGHCYHGASVAKKRIYLWKMFHSSDDRFEEKPNF